MPDGDALRISTTRTTRPAKRERLSGSAPQLGAIAMTQADFGVILQHHERDAPERIHAAVHDLPDATGP
jgi:hypothetical protein